MAKNRDKSGPGPRRKVDVVTCCLNANGAPDFACTEHEATQAEIDSGHLFERVEEQLGDDGFEAPFLHFLETDPPRGLFPMVREYLNVPEPADSLRANDDFQFARTLAELRAMGLAQEDKDALAERLDLEPAELEEVFARAAKRYDQIKRRQGLVTDPGRRGRKARWIIEWHDGSGDPDHDIKETADGRQEAHDAIVRILEGEEWSPPQSDADEDREPACPAMVRELFGGDIHSGLEDMRPRDACEWPTVGGNLVVTRES